MFVTKCFIRKYTPELFLRVMDMGYDVCGPDPKSDVIECGDNTCCAYKLPFDGHLMSYVDCGTNEDMFLSLAAMNDETDKYQWFIVGTEMEWVLCDTEDFKDCVHYRGDDVLYRKANMLEIIYKYSGLNPLNGKYLKQISDEILEVRFEKGLKEIVITLK